MFRVREELGMCLFRKSPSWSVPCLCKTTQTKEIYMYKLKLSSIVATHHRVQLAIGQFWPWCLYHIRWNAYISLPIEQDHSWPWKHRKVRILLPKTLCISVFVHITNALPLIIVNSQYSKIFTSIRVLIPAVLFRNLSSVQLIMYICLVTNGRFYVAFSLKAFPLVHVLSIHAYSLETNPG